MTFGEKGNFLGAPERNWSEFGVVPENTAYDLVYKALDAGISPQESRIQLQAW
ncbi:aldo/keto reductase family oxidoreductase [Vibrio sp. MEBiC08052]|nr:aldo/keto reductase family oxidoreductase [Vibrio sp. MEBiC08052]